MAKSISAVSPTVYRLVDGVVHVAVSVTALFMVIDCSIPGPVYDPAPVPFQALNTTCVPFASVSLDVTVKCAVEPGLYHPLPAVIP